MCKWEAYLNQSGFRFFKKYFQSVLFFFFAYSIGFQKFDDI